MSNPVNPLFDMRQLQTFSEKDTPISRLHPTSKLIITFLFLFTLVSYEKHEISALIPLVLFPVVLMTLGEVPVMPVFKRILLVEPFIIGIGIVNPLFSKTSIYVCSHEISSGWLIFASIFIKCTLSVFVGLTYLSTTGIVNIALSLRSIGVPDLFVLQILLTYRYIHVLMEEFSRVLRAYSFRSNSGKKLKRAAWGPMLGQIVIRSFSRAERIYDAMRLRGFNGEYKTGKIHRFKSSDLFFILFWGIFFFICRYYDIPLEAGNFITKIF